ncbi:helix-turn-helix transcriptional regulator [uncultured Sulfitobacter sp.]|uniref:helix-turn-helix domain-containing protein n=1 Tax=uncultured Sulfitobacter sp. TaxID=191468 RepID=UPI00261BA889|nr:helix-turn-helix transcriptional regulator [uncultured Sulfitobacter sp.]
MPDVAQEILTAFGDAVRKANGLKGWSLDSLGAAITPPMSKGYLSRIQNGKRQLSPATVGKLIKVLDLDESWMDRFLGNAEDEVTQEDRRAEQLLSATGHDEAIDIAENLMIALAYEYAEGDANDLDSAYRGLKVALQTAVEMKARAALPDNTDAGISAVRAEVQRLNEAEELDEAAAAIDAAMAQKTAEVSALLDLGVQQDRMRNEPEAAAAKLVQQVMLDAPTEPLNALRNVMIEWYERGRDGGLAFEATVAIQLARSNLAFATDANARGTVQNDLGNTLSILGARESETARLDEAVLAYREALKEWSRERVPLEWAMTQNNLGNALKFLGERESGTMRLDEAVVAFREALKERTHARVPLDWATTQNNLGNALKSLGERESGTARLDEAVMAYREALKERTRKQVPLDWAMTQNNLGNALATLGVRESGTARLDEAVLAYREALKERTRERVPLQWAMTQNNLGNALRSLGVRESGTARLDEAVEAFREALKERTRTRVPLDWAMTQFNIALVYLAYFGKDGTVAHLDVAERHVLDAREVFDEAGATHYLGLADTQLARIQSLRD